MIADSGRPGPPVTVAASGNWMLGSDRIGPAVLERLEGRIADDVELADLGSGSLALLDHLRGQELLILVDACVGRGTPGEVMVAEPSANGVPSGWPSVHQIGPVETLAVARQLYPELMPEHVRLVLVETSTLDQELETRACREAVATVEREVAQWRLAKSLKSSRRNEDRETESDVADEARRRSPTTSRAEEVADGPVSRSEEREVEQWRRSRRGGERDSEP